MSKTTEAPRQGELLDIVDEQGEPTGQVLDKGAIHSRGLLHRDVHLWLTNGRDLLQQQRTWDKSIMPGAWDITVGGHVSSGESYLEAVMRETEEELGLQFRAERFINVGRIASQLVIPGWEYPHNVVGDNYVILEPDLAVTDLRLQEEEVISARWYNIEQLAVDVRDPVTATLHAPQPPALYALGIAGMRGVIAA